MFEATSPAVALWEGPPWANSRDVVDEGAVEHRRCIGEIVPVEHDDPIVVDVVQRDEFDLSAEPISVTRSSAQVCVAGTRLDPDQARQLGGLLIGAADVIDGGATTEAA